MNEELRGWSAAARLTSDDLRNFIARRCVTVHWRPCGAGEMLNWSAGRCNVSTKCLVGSVVSRARDARRSDEQRSAGLSGDGERAAGARDRHDRSSERSRGYEPVWPKSRLEPRQCKDGADRARANRTEHDAVERRVAADLIARNQRKQGPIATCKEEESDGAQQGRREMSIIPGMAYTGAQGTMLFIATAADISCLGTSCGTTDCHAGALAADPDSISKMNSSSVEARHQPHGCRAVHPRTDIRDESRDPDGRECRMPEWTPRRMCYLRRVRRARRIHPPGDALRRRRLLLVVA